MLAVLCREKVLPGMPTNPLFYPLIPWEVTPVWEKAAVVKVPQRASARSLVPVVGWTAGVDDPMVGID